MKRYTILLLFLLIGLGSCKDFLEEPPRGQQNANTFFKTKEECTMAIMGCYWAADGDDWWKIDRTRMFGDVASDDAWKGNAIPGDQRELGDFGRFFWDPNNEWFDNRWVHIYQSIGNCNFAIEGIGKAPIDETVKAQLIAEAKFLRAYNYFELVKGYGGVPLVVQPVTSPADAAKIKRSTREQCFEQIIKDFKEAAVDLPEKSARNASEKGRATKGAANGYLAKAYLFTEKWSEAQQAAEAVINSKQYNLNDDFSKVWSVDNPNGNESIFEINYNASQTFNLGNSLTVVMRSRADGGWGFNTPSSHLEQAFLKENDPRLKYTIIRQGDSVAAKTPTFDYSKYDTKPSENESGRMSRKMFLLPSERPANEREHSPLNRIELRYADLLLMHAEASYRLTQEDKARISLNEVRARANRLNPGSVFPRVSTGTDLLNHIWLERRLELAMEGHRYYDLVRQKRLVQVIQEFVDYNLHRSTDPYDKGKDAKSLVSEKNNYFPIPLREIQLSEGNLEQNNGYQ